jgi:hypothetical protein
MVSGDEHNSDEEGMYAYASPAPPARHIILMEKQLAPLDCDPPLHPDPGGPAEK